MARSDKDSVERLRRKLYARNAKGETGEERTPLQKDIDSVHPPTSWESAEPTAPEPGLATELPSSTPPLMTHKKKFSLAAKFLMGSFVFFVLATGAAAYMFFGGGNLISPSNIDVEIVTPSLVDGGKAASLQISVRNRNQTELELADLVIKYPQGTRSPNDLSQDLTTERISLGTIAPGQQIQHPVSAVFYGSEGTEQNIHATLEYSVAGSNAVFEKNADAKFTIGSSPVSLSVSAPERTTSGDQFSIDVEVRSNAVSPISDVALQAQYPFGFQSSDTNPSADEGDAYWRLGTLEPGSVKKIRITGSIDGQDGDERVFRFLVGSVADETQTSVTVPFLIVPQTVTVSQPFITGGITVGGQSGKNVTAQPGSTVQGTVTWKNNLSEPVSNVELTLALSGPALQDGSIQASNGFYQSRDSSIIWTKEQEPSLAEIQPGESGSAQFSFSTLSAGSGGVLIKNPTIDLSLSVRGTRGEDSNSEMVSSAASTHVTLASTPTLEAQAAHFTGPFNNSGPMPPRAESDTTYTIIWTVKNPSNTVANANVSTVLPPYVKFLDSQGGAGIVYDDDSRTVRWDLGDISAGVGFTLPVRQAAFQVRFSPSTSQVGQSPALTGNATLTGQDRFAQVEVQASAAAPTIVLSGENGFSNRMGTVDPK
jgi:hypothetical protein